MRAWLNGLSHRIKSLFNLSILAMRILKDEGVVCLWWNLMHFLSKKKRTPFFDYSGYIQENSPSAVELVNQRKQSYQFSYHPLISVIIPVYNPPLEILKKTLNSVVIQSYENWEICIVDGNSHEKEIRDLMQDYSDKYRPPPESWWCQ